MIDPLSLGVGGLIAFMSWAIGRRRGTPKKLPDPKLICSCKHGYGTHEKEDGRCLGQVKQPVRWRIDRYGDDVPSHFEWVACPCISYDGPEPLPRAFDFSTPLELPKADDT